MRKKQNDSLYFLVTFHYSSYFILYTSLVTVMVELQLVLTEVCGKILIERVHEIT